MEMNEFDFSGWATKNDLECSDGRVIRRDAFKHCDGKKVPLVWNHDHTDPYRVVGHALLENREDGVYAYGKFNETDLGKTAKMYVQHGDITQLSIYANQLKQQGPNVIHGAIREVSLVLAGANPGAFIENVMVHGEESDEEATIFTGENITLCHASDDKQADENGEGADKKPEAKEGEDTPEDKTIQEVIDSMNKDQKNVMYYLIGEALKGETKDVKHSDSENSDDHDDETVEDVINSMTPKQRSAMEYVVEEALKKVGESDNNNTNEGDDSMKHNVFDTDNQQENNTLMHADIANAAIADARRYGSLKESVLQHAAVNNITNIGDLFPMAKDLNMPPEWIKEDETWVTKIMTAVHHTPFSKVRALFAQLDENEARAQGYIKGNEKDKYMKLAILKRTTQPTTVYIKMAMDRDDVVDITDFDVVAWQRAEMRKQLDKELARAFLLGDGRLPGTDGKIDENCIVPVLTDDDMYTIKYTVTDGTDFHNDFNSASENDSEAKGVIRAAVKARKQYKGSGKPTFFTTEDLLTELLLIEDQNGRRIYESEAALATAMRVKEIVTIPEMEKNTDIYGIIVNFNDYNTGADKGGSVNMFDDFDIDFNQLKYLMECRCSAALVRPKSAIVLKKASE